MKSLDYVIIQINDESDFKNRKIIIAKKSLESVVKDCKINSYKILKEFSGNEFKNTICFTHFQKLVLIMIFQCLMQDLLRQSKAQV